MVDALTCCCTQFTMEECEAFHDTTKGHCVWRTRPSFGPSIGEKGICRTQRWIDIQQATNEHHPQHSPSPTTSLELVEEIESYDVNNPTNYNWPQICFEEGDKLPCNQPEESNNDNEAAVAAVPVEVGDQHINQTKHLMSVGLLSTIVAFITFIGLSIGVCVYSLYWKLRAKATNDDYDSVKEGLNGGFSLKSSYSTFAGV